MWNSQSRKHGSSQSNKTPYIMPIVYCSCSTYPRATDFLSIGLRIIFSLIIMNVGLYYMTAYPFCDGNIYRSILSSSIPSLLTISRCPSTIRKGIQPGNDHNILSTQLPHYMYTHDRVSPFFSCVAASKRSITCSIQHYWHTHTLYGIWFFFLPCRWEIWNSSLHDARLCGQT